MLDRFKHWYMAQLAELLEARGHQRSHDAAAINEYIDERLRKVRAAVEADLADDVSGFIIGELMESDTNGAAEKRHALLPLRREGGNAEFYDLCGYTERKMRMHALVLLPSRGHASRSVVTGISNGQKPLYAAAGGISVHAFNAQTADGSLFIRVWNEVLIPGIPVNVRIHTPQLAL